MAHPGSGAGNARPRRFRANANFGLERPEHFLDHLGIPLETTRTLAPHGHPALFVALQPVPEAEGYRSVVAVVTRYGEDFSIGNKCDPALFEQVLASVHLFEPE